MSQAPSSVFSRAEDGKEQHPTGNQTAHHAEDLSVSSNSATPLVHDDPREELEMTATKKTSVIQMPSPPTEIIETKRRAPSNDNSAMKSAYPFSSSPLSVSQSIDEKNQNVPTGDDSKPEDTISHDSYGLPLYHPRYPNIGGAPPPSVSNDLSVPWNLRKPSRKMSCTFFDVLRAPQFWKQFEFATRITSIAVLVPAAIIAARLPHSPFVSPYMAMSSTVLGARVSVGEAIAYVFSWTRAGMFWLPLAVIGGALHLGQHIAGWCVYYTAILLVLATFSEGIMRRICLLLFNSCMVGLLVNEQRDALYPCRVMVDWCIGTGLCTAASFFPYPVFCKREAQRLLSDVAKNIGTAFRGLSYSFWSSTNVERNMAMSKVHVMTDSVDVLLPQFEHNQAFSFFEFFFESTEVREIREIKFHLFERLRVNLSCMTRVLDMVERKPHVVDGSDRCQAFGDMLTPPLNNVAESFDELIDRLAGAKTRAAILDLAPHMDAFKSRTEELQDAYLLARRMLFYEHTSATLEEFVPLMTFYLFTVICFRDTLEVFDMKVKAYKPSARKTIRGILEKAIIDPFMENIGFLCKLVTKWQRHEIQRVVESAKVSGAMILTIGFSYLIDIDKASFSGPNIIAFVSGNNPVEAVQASIVRLTGCLIGSVLGFFAGTYSETPVQRVASLCTLMFVGTFLRSDKDYGIMAVYAMFVLIPLDSIVATTTDDTIARMNQNTFGIFIYLFVSIFVFPLSPSVILRAKRCNVLRLMRDALREMMDLFASQPVNRFGQCSPACSADDSAPKENAEPQVSNRSMHLLLRNDDEMNSIRDLLDSITKRLKGTKEFMAFAKDERGLVEIDYPAKTCGEVYSHMYRMTVLLKTMSLSWNVIRSQPWYTDETKHMMQNLQPIACDVSRSFGRFVDLITYMMQDPAVNLEGELMKAVLDLIVAAQELHTRKSQIMLMLINVSVKDYVDRVEAQEAADTSTNRRKGSNHDNSNYAIDHKDPNRAAAATTDFAARAEDDGRLSKQPSESRTRPSTPAAYCTGGSDVLTFNHAEQDFRVVPSERNVTILPFLRRSRSNVAERVALTKAPVRLPSTFQFPISSEDAEGMHSLTLCLEMFAEETKLLMLSLSAMLDLLRSKL